MTFKKPYFNFNKLLAKSFVLRKTVKVCPPFVSLLRNEEVKELSYTTQRKISYTFAGQQSSPYEVQKKGTTKRSGFCFTKSASPLPRWDKVSNRSSAPVLLRWEEGYKKISRRLNSSLLVTPFLFPFPTGSRAEGSEGSFTTEKKKQSNFFINCKGLFQKRIRQIIVYGKRKNSDVSLISEKKTKNLTKKEKFPPLAEPFLGFTSTKGQLPKEKKQPPSLLRKEQQTQKRKKTFVNVKEVKKPFLPYPEKNLILSNRISNVCKIFNNVKKKKMDKNFYSNLKLIFSKNVPNSLALSIFLKLMETKQKKLAPFQKSDPSFGRTEGRFYDRQKSKPYFSFEKTTQEGGKKVQATSFVTRFLSLVKNNMFSSDKKKLGKVKVQKPIALQSNSTSIEGGGGVAGSSLSSPTSSSFFASQLRELRPKNAGVASFLPKGAFSSVFLPLPVDSKKLAEGAALQALRVCLSQKSKQKKRDEKKGSFAGKKVFVSSNLNKDLRTKDDKIENTIDSLSEKYILSKNKKTFKTLLISKRKINKDTFGNTFFSALSFSDSLNEQTILKKLPLTKLIPLKSSYSKLSEIQLITIALASSEKIREWAEKTLPTGKILGQITNANTLHHKTFKPVKGGLFCDRVFGPLKDFTCACGKFKKPQYKHMSKIQMSLNLMSQRTEPETSFKKKKSSLLLLSKGRNKNFDSCPPSLLRKEGEESKKKNPTQKRKTAKTFKQQQKVLKKIVNPSLIKRNFCPVCDVEYTFAVIRRYQLGYIRLAAPVTHVWYLKATPSHLSLLFDIKKKDLESIIYCAKTMTLELSIRGGQNVGMPKSIKNLLESWKKLMPTTLLQKEQKMKEKKTSLLLEIKTNLYLFIDEIDESKLKKKEFLKSFDPNSGFKKNHTNKFLKKSFHFTKQIDTFLFNNKFILNQTKTEKKILRLTKFFPSLLRFSKKGAEHKKSKPSLLPREELGSYLRCCPPYFVRDRGLMGGQSSPRRLYLLRKSFADSPKKAIVVRKGLKSRPGLRIRSFNFKQNSFFMDLLKRKFFWNFLFNIKKIKFETGKESNLNLVNLKNSSFFHYAKGKKGTASYYGSPRNSYFLPLRSKEGALAVRSKEKEKFYEQLCRGEDLRITRKIDKKLFFLIFFLPFITKVNKILNFSIPLIFLPLRSKQQIFSKRDNSFFQLPLYSGYNKILPLSIKRIKYTNRLNENLLFKLRKLDFDKIHYPEFQQNFTEVRFSRHDRKKSVPPLPLLSNRVDGVNPSFTSRTSFFDLRGERRATQRTLSLFCYGCKGFGATYSQREAPKKKILTSLFLETGEELLPPMGLCPKEGGQSLFEAAFFPLQKRRKGSLAGFGKAKKDRKRKNTKFSFFFNKKQFNKLASKSFIFLNKSIINKLPISQYILLKNEKFIKKKNFFNKLINIIFCYFSTLQKSVAQARTKNKKTSNMVGSNFSATLSLFRKARGTLLPFLPSHDQQSSYEVSTSFLLRNGVSLRSKQNRNSLPPFFALPLWDRDEIRRSTKKKDVGPVGVRSEKKYLLKNLLFFSDVYSICLFPSFHQNPTFNLNLKQFFLQKTTKRIKFLQTLLKNLTGSFLAESYGHSTNYESPISSSSFVANKTSMWRRQKQLGSNNRKEEKKNVLFTCPRGKEVRRGKRSLKASLPLAKQGRAIFIKKIFLTKKFSSLPPEQPKDAFPSSGQKGSLASFLSLSLSVTQKRERAYDTQYPLESKEGAPYVIKKKLFYSSFFHYALQRAASLPQAVNLLTNLEAVTNKSLTINDKNSFLEKRQKDIYFIKTKNSLIFFYLLNFYKKNKIKLFFEYVWLLFYKKTYKKLFFYKTFLNNKKLIEKEKDIYSFSLIKRFFYEIKQIFKKNIFNFNIQFLKYPYQNKNVKNFLLDVLLPYEVSNKESQNKSSIHNLSIFSNNTFKLSVFQSVLVSPQYPKEQGSSSLRFELQVLSSFGGRGGFGSVGEIKIKEKKFNLLKKIENSIYSNALQTKQLSLNIESLTNIIKKRFLLLTYPLSYISSAFYDCSVPINVQKNKKKTFFKFNSYERWKKGIKSKKIKKKTLQNKEPLSSLRGDRDPSSAVQAQRVNCPSQNLKGLCSVGARSRDSAINTYVVNKEISFMKLVCWGQKKTRIIPNSFFNTILFPLYISNLMNKSIFSKITSRACYSSLLYKSIKAYKASLLTAFFPLGLQHPSVRPVLPRGRSRTFEKFSFISKNPHLPFFGNRKKDKSLSFLQRGAEPFLALQGGELPTFGYAPPSLLRKEKNTQLLPPPALPAFSGSAPLEAPYLLLSLSVTQKRDKGQEEKKNPSRKQILNSTDGVDKTYVLIREREGKTDSVENNEGFPKGAKKRISLKKRNQNITLFNLSLLKQQLLKSLQLLFFKIGYDYYSKNLCKPFTFMDSNKDSEREEKKENLSGANFTVFQTVEHPLVSKFLKAKSSSFLKKNFFSFLQKNKFPFSQFDKRSLASKKISLLISKERISSTSTPKRPKLVNNIYTLSHRFLWNEKESQNFIFYVFTSEKSLDKIISIYKSRFSFLLLASFYSEKNILKKNSFLYVPNGSEAAQRKESNAFNSNEKNSKIIENTGKSNKQSLAGIRTNTLRQHSSKQSKGYVQRKQNNAGLNIFGAGIIHKMLSEFDLNEQEKIDRQNQILLNQFNKTISKLKNFFYEKSVKRRFKQLCKERELLIKRTKAIRFFTRSNEQSNKTINKRQNINKDYSLLSSLMNKKSQLNSMILTNLPVLPPDLRPILKIGGQIAASDLNRLYQRVIYRNDRLKKFVKYFGSMGPASAHTYEMKYAQRLLQEAVDNLIQNGKSGVIPEKDSRGRALKSLSEILKGKQGRFRQYLLGKRVDYSGRSVIIVGPKLKLHQCGLPKEMALELYLPFLIKRILKENYAKTVIGAKILIKTNKNLIWPLLREIMQTCPVLLNRAPTLHRLGFQAFQPKLIEGKAILLHPLVCPPFNADFDGDQMAVHVPLTIQARTEAWKLMLSRNNLLSPATGQIILLPTQDMVLGCYYLTANCNKFAIPHQRGNKKYFNNFDDVLKAYYQQKIDLHAIIWVKWTGAVEYSNEKAYPLELRINSFGYWQKIFFNYYSTFDLKGTKINNYIRTTPGKILFNITLQKAFKNKVF